MAQTEPAPSHPDPARKAGQAMAQALGALLDRAPGARAALPYLAALQSGLVAEGTAVLDVIPLPSLRRMGSQLASLPVQPEDRPLRALQVALLAALSRRDMPQAPSTFLHSTMGPDQLEVQEIGDSEWAAASDLFHAEAGQPPDQPK